MTHFSSFLLQVNRASFLKLQNPGKPIRMSENSRKYKKKKLKRTTTSIIYIQRRCIIVSTICCQVLVMIWIPNGFLLLWILVSIGKMARNMLLSSLKLHELSPQFPVYLRIPSLASPSFTLLSLCFFNTDVSKEKDGKCK